MRLLSVLIGVFLFTGTFSGLISCSPKSQKEKFNKLPRDGNGDDNTTKKRSYIGFVKNCVTGVEEVKGNMIYELKCSEGYEDLKYLKLYDKLADWADAKCDEFIEIKNKTNKNKDKKVRTARPLIVIFEKSSVLSKKRFKCEIKSDEPFGEKVDE